MLLVVVALLTPNLPLLSIVLRLTVTVTGIFPLLSTTPITFSLPLESTKDCCFVILIGLLIVLAAVACAVATNEGNCSSSSSRTESVIILTNNDTPASFDIKSPVLTLYHLQDYDCYLATTP